MRGGPSLLLPRLVKWNQQKEIGEMTDSGRTLEAYEQKRDFGSTPEPSDGESERRQSGASQCRGH